MTPEKQRGIELALSDRNNELARQLKDAEAMLEQQGERLFELQTTIEVQAEALGKTDAQLMEFVGKLNGIMGGEVANEEGAIARMTFLRREAARMEAIREILDDTFEADGQMLMDLGAALRMPQEYPTTAEVLTRASALADVENKNAELYRLNIEAERKLAKLAEDAAE